MIRGSSWLIGFMVFVALLVVPKLAAALLVLALFLYIIAWIALVIVAGIVQPIASAAEHAHRYLEKPRIAELTRQQRLVADADRQHDAILSGDDYIGIYGNFPPAPINGAYRGDRDARRVVSTTHRAPE
jgi:predicted PurR-regulated permease PerM